MTRKLFLLAGLLWSIAASAQFTPFVPGQVLTAAQLNSAFSFYAPLTGATFTGPLSATALVGTPVSGSSGSFTNLSASGTVNFPAGTITPASLSPQAANTLLANASGSSASPTAISAPSCSTSSSALQWASGSGLACNTAINSTTLGGVAAASYLTSASASSTYAPLASPTFTGIATVPVNSLLSGSPTAGDATNKISTTFYVQNALNNSQPATFTALSATANDALFYSNSTAQSFTSGTSATVTGWTKVFDRVNTNFNATTGTFTAPANGIYHVVAQLSFAANTGAVATVGQIFINANGTTVAANNWIRQTATSTTMVPQVSADVSLTAGQTIVIQGSQNTGAAVTLNGSAVLNFVSIHRVP